MIPGICTGRTSPIAGTTAGPPSSSSTSPLPKQGTAGQIVRYLHNPDELAAIADSFDDYLEMLMENEYGFISEDTVNE